MSDLDRSARAMTVLTAVSRLSGFARVLVFTYVFGKTYLANTYVSANTVPNILFELFAAGALQAVLVPTMVRFVQKGHEEAEEIAGTLLGLLCGALAFIGVAAAALAAPIMGLLVGDVRDAAVRQAEIELGAVFLWFFLPQLVFYGANIIATAVLNAHNRFALPVFAPALNNAVVITAYLVFDALHEGPLVDRGAAAPAHSKRCDIRARVAAVVAGGARVCEHASVRQLSDGRRADAELLGCLARREATCHAELIGRSAAALRVPRRSGYSRTRIRFSRRLEPKRRDHHSRRRCHQLSLA